MKMESIQNQVQWLKGSILSYDYVITPKEIYFVKIAPTLTWPLLSVVFVAFLVVGLGFSFFIPAAIVAMFIAVTITVVIFTFVRRRLYKLSLEDLAKRKGVKRIIFSDVVSIESKGTVLSIVTKDGTLFGRMKKSDIQLVKLYAISPKG